MMSSFGQKIEHCGNDTKSESYSSKSAHSFHPHILGIKHGWSNDYNSQYHDFVVGAVC
jgi:hypothetical protein